MYIYISLPALLSMLYIVSSGSSTSKMNTVAWLSSISRTRKVYIVAHLNQMQEFGVEDNGLLSQRH